MVAESDRTVEFNLPIHGWTIYPFMADYAFRTI